MRNRIRETVLICIALLAGARCRAEVPQTYFLELEGEPLARSFAKGEKPTALKARADGLAATRRRAAVGLRSADPTSKIVFETHNLINGIAFRGDAARLAEIKSASGAKAVHALRHATAHTGRSVPFIEAPAFWEATGLTGRGVTIAVIDSGIDYLHADFGGPGGGYDANDTTIIGDAPNFPGARVVGGWDFCGDDYNSIDQDNNEPKPDPDPMDCRGHGSHVAGIAAGGGVTAEGQAYAGPYDTTTPAGTMRIGPGVAPEASLYALRVFGCTGTTDLILEAMDWAMDPNGDGDLSDHVDVINFSLGAEYATAADPAQAAADAAAEAGVIVVASAGNSGDSYFNVASPSSADRVISVASCLDDRDSTDTADIASIFSSRGPTTSGNRLKPDITAPGDGIYSVSTGTGTEAKQLSGTSMAAPHVAGAMALFRGAHPDWTVEELKALLMNTARREIYINIPKTTPYCDPGRAGAGRLALSEALGEEVLAYATEPAGAVSLSFGLVEASSDLTVEKSLTLLNKGTQPRTVTLAYESRADAAGVEIDFPDGPTYEVAPGASVQARVRLAVTFAALRHDREPTVPSIQGGRPRHWITSETGLILATPDGGKPLRVPAGATVRAVSEMNAATASVPLDATSGSFNIGLAGRGLNTGIFPPFDIVSTLFPFELAYESAPDPDYAGGFESADIHRVGIRVLPNGADPAAATLLFGVASHGNWGALIGDTGLSINIDLNGDHKADRLFFRTAFASGPGYTDAYASIVYNFTTGVFSQRVNVNILKPDQRDTVANNTNIITLSVAASDLGITAANPVFEYQVVAYHLDDIDKTKATPWLRCDASRAGLTFDQTYYDDLPDTVIGVNYDRDAYLQHRSKGLLLFHQNNAAGAHDEVVALPPQGLRALGDLDASGCTDLTDFLIILDMWQLDYQGEVVGIADFMNLLDNWFTGPGC